MLLSQPFLFNGLPVHDINGYCMELFVEDVQIAAASHDLFAKRANEQIYRPLVEKYIAGEKRL